MSEAVKTVSEKSKADAPSAPSVNSTRTSPEDSKSSDDNNSKPLSSSSAKQKNPMKVDILLKHIGDAPIMTKRKWTVDRTKKISWVADFIKKYIKSDSTESLFLYVNQSFAPAPDTDLGSIFDCFNSDGKLVLHYCRTQAYG
ncbi:ubiquitin-like protein atg12 [Plakobranchus ocellatus]|uniref:Ubiquitin-like protein ATG12 n=1 Tax=Plakobranchus ocellatus TaxID=259542 RepID=A0AAV4A332_9GAST|nr:ubiquitin-like protein atg12 [Plakobranchus ocellatus]